MKRLVFWQLFVAALLLTSNSHAQSIKDLFNKENIEKAVNAVTGKSTADMTGTWSYTGSAIEFESDNLLQKAGGAVAATAAEKKLDEQLAKVGIKAGQMSFTFNADSTFSAKVGQKSMKGSYSYDASTQKVNLKFAKLARPPASSALRSGWAAASGPAWAAPAKRNTAISGSARTAPCWKRRRSYGEYKSDPLRH